MLVLDRVSFAFGPRPVVNDVSFSLAAGEIVCVLGPNGAGKTTLLRLAGGLLPTTSGSVRLGTDDPRVLSRPLLARRVAYLPQDYSLAFPFTVADVVLMGRYPYHPRGLLRGESGHDLDLAQAAMERCDVATLADRRFDELSGGERRRALLAQAFCQAAPLVLLDEPTAALDPAHALAVFRALKEERDSRGASAFIATHDLNLSARFADRVLLLDHGQVRALGPPTAVLAGDAAANTFSVGLHIGTIPTTSTPFAVAW